jgi:HSP20 family molecular chaperone IbpA
MTHLTFIERQLQPFDVLFKNLFEATSPFTPAIEAKFPHPVDIYENSDGLYFEVACTGLTKDQVGISVEGDIIRINYNKINKDSSESEKGLEYIHKGIARRSFNLGYKVATKYDLSQAEAEMENGLLKIYVPFAKEAKPKALTIK